MSDNEIRKILAERKRRERMNEILRDYIEGFVGFASLAMLALMFAIMGG